MPLRNGNIIFSFSLAAIILLSACSTQNTYRALSFFFDGVPNPGDADKVVLNDSMQLSLGLDSTLTIAKNSSPEVYYHLPYLDKECASCHNQGQMGSLNSPEPGLCFQCHRDRAMNSFQHGPVSSGYCSNCHHPHKSKMEKLLLQDELLLCFGCHESGTIYENIYHNISDEKECGKCHDAHGSNNHSLLQNGACYLCHEDFDERFEVLHGPVQAGLCSECHSSHAKGSNVIITKRGNELCADCHGTVRLFENVFHVENQDMRCTECHDPHGGEDQFMFK